MTDTLFDVADPDPGREHQACDRCLGGAWASNDALRARGWLVYNGTSQNGRPLNVRVCPACQRKETRS